MHFILFEVYARNRNSDEMQVDGKAIRQRNNVIINKELIFCIFLFGIFSLFFCIFYLMSKIKPRSEDEFKSEVNASGSTSMDWTIKNNEGFSFLKKRKSRLKL